MVAGFHLDGYIEIFSSDNSKPYTIGFEYNSCHVHQCPDNCRKSLQSHAEIVKDYKRIALLQSSLDELHIMRSCQWHKQRKKLNYTSKLSRFIGKNQISEEQILEAVLDGHFFGMVKVDLTTPDHIIEKYKHLNFPLIFSDAEITEEMLSESTLTEVRKSTRKFPHKCLTLKWNAVGIILATPLLQFYLSIGMIATNIEWALQYNESRPFERFVQELVDVRVNSFGTNKPLGDRSVAE